MDDGHPTETAAYGVRLTGVGPTPALALSGAGRWPRVRLVRELVDAEPPLRSTVGEDRATIVSPAATFLVDRASATVQVRSAAPVSEADIVHPGLWPVAAVFARWRGAETLHAGAFVAPDGDGAWAVMAESGGGKSSFLAALAIGGAEVLVDDLLVMERGTCFAGPRTLDLRPDTLGHLGLGDRGLDTVRATSRSRLMLDPCVGSWPIRGFIELGWGPTVSSRRLSPLEALAALAGHRRVLGLGAEHAELLELVARPVIRFTRPRDWSVAHDVAAAMLELVISER